MKIGIIKETKIPVDNRVALTPNQIVKLKQQFPNADFVVQSSDLRVYTDEEYKSCGITVKDDMSDCDVLFGIKEANIESIISDKHYFFFGHIAKQQEYNKPLAKAMLEKRISFSDYEYLVNADGQRVCAFGWYAGLVGVYYTLRAYGLRTGQIELPKPDRKFTLNELIARIASLDVDVRILITGGGRVSQGAQYVLDAVKATKVDVSKLASMGKPRGIEYAVLLLPDLVENASRAFNSSEFKANPQEYRSIFMNYAPYADVLISCHFWGANNPVYLDEEDLQNPKMKIKVIGDVTCDIMGSIKSTLRSSTHDDPFYDYNPITKKEEPAFSSDENITVMAVDTCPNALALDASEYFGNLLSEFVFKPILQGEVDTNNVIGGATIINRGVFTDKFSYLNDFVK